MKQLHDYAKKLGVQIKYTDLNPFYRSGDYHAATNTIRLQQGMTYRKERSVLAHELAHATFRDEPSIFAHFNAKQEQRADEWAAHFLINHEEYRLAEEKYGLHTNWIAQELGILERLVKAYERTLHRIGDIIYVKPNLGIAQQKIRA